MVADTKSNDCYGEAEKGQHSCYDLHASSGYRSGIGKTTINSNFMALKDKKITGGRVNNYPCSSLI